MNWALRNEYKSTGGYEGKKDLSEGVKPGLIWGSPLGPLGDEAGEGTGPGV